MLVVGNAQQHPLLAQRGKDLARHVAGVPAGQRAVAVHVDARLVDRRDHGQAKAPGEIEVLLATAGRDVHDARALLGADAFVGLAALLPHDHAVLHAGLRRQLVEGTAVAPALHRAAQRPAQDLDGLVPEDVLEGTLGHPVDVALVAHAHVRQVGVDRSGHVGGERPRRGGPDHQRVALLGGRSGLEQRQGDEGRGVDDVAVLVGQLGLGEPGPAARTPGHHVVALVDPAVLVAAFEEQPDGVVVLIGHRVVGVVPVHPVAQADRLLRLHGGVGQDALLAALHEPGDAIRLDVALVVKAQLLLDLDLDVQALAVEAVLVALLEALHRLEALEDVLIRAAPGMVHAHGVIGRDRPIQE